MEITSFRSNFSTSNRLDACKDFIEQQRNCNFLARKASFGIPRVLQLLRYLIIDYIYFVKLKSRIEVPIYTTRNIIIIYFISIIIIVVTIA